MSRVAGMPIYKQQTIEIDAKIFNLWHRAKQQLSLPIRFDLQGYRGLVMILQDNEWLCANERQYDLPIICWLNFEDEHRTSLHLGIKCQRNYYHYAAEKIQQQILQLMCDKLENMLLNKKDFKLKLKDKPL